MLLILKSTLTCMQTCTYTHAHAYTLTCTHTHMHTHTHTYTYAHTRMHKTDTHIIAKYKPCTSAVHVHIATHPYSMVGGSQGEIKYFL